jgi:hypothetical protein
MFKGESLEIGESVAPDSAPLGAVCNYAKDGLPPDSAILMLGPKFGNAGTKSRNRVTQVQHGTVKAAQLEVCDGVRYSRTDLRWDRKHQYLVAHLPVVAHAARVCVCTTPSTIPPLGTNPTVSPDPEAPVVWTKERSKFHTKIGLPPTFTTEYELPTNTPDPVIPFDGAQRIMAVADVDPLNEMGGACVNFEFPDKTTRTKR